MRKAGLLFAVLMSFALSAADTLTLVSPKVDEVVSLMPSVFKDYLVQDRAMRRARFADAQVRAHFRTAEPEGWPRAVTFAWEGTAGGELRVTRLPDGKVFFCGHITSNTYALTNFEIARQYAWQVTSGGQTRTGKFYTEDLAPRLLRWPGVPNLRDLGGRVGYGGKRVKQGLVFRSAGLNGNASFDALTEEAIIKAVREDRIEKVLAGTVDGNGKPTDVAHYAPTLRALVAKGPPLPKYYVNAKFLLPETAKPGRVRLTPESRAWGLAFFGIKTDLDLRSWRECWGMTGSPLGPGVQWINYSSSDYAGMSSAAGRAAFTRCFKVFLDPANYPIVFHCIAGADRTGAVAFILNALLGVPEEELWRDWEATGFTNAAPHFNHKDRLDHLVAVFDAYPGATINERVAQYVRSLGFTEGDMARLREILLED